MSASNTGDVDLEAVLNVRRRTLVSIGGSSSATQQPNYTDTVYLKRIDKSQSILTIDSTVYIFGELQLLFTIFERYTASLIVYEDTITNTTNFPLASLKTSFSVPREEDEQDIDEPPIVSTLRQTKISSPKGSSSPPQTPGSPPCVQKLASVGHSQTIASATNEYSTQSLEGKRYGFVEVPHMTMIEILEIILRTGLEIVNVSSDYDQNHVLHQNFVFSKARVPLHKFIQPFSRTSSVSSNG